MTTDDERREAARRLRGQAKKLGPNMDAPEFAHYTADVIDVNECMTWYEMELRLADLIEPSESGQNRDRNQDSVQKESPIVQIEHECDREALLALADELEEDACWEVQTPGDTSGAWRLKDACDRIREALGGG